MQERRKALSEPCDASLAPPCIQISLKQRSTQQQRKALVIGAARLPLSLAQPAIPTPAHRSCLQEAQQTLRL
jgi:hypothetical protein